MAKPICVIYLPEDFSIDGRSDAAMTLMKALNNNWGEPDRHITYSDYWQDYYWFCFVKHSIDAPEFEIFHEKDFTEIKFQELKDLVLAKMEEMKIEKQN